MNFWAFDILPDDILLFINIEYFSWKTFINTVNKIIGEEDTFSKLLSSYIQPNPIESKLDLHNEY